MILCIKIELRILHFSDQVRETSSWNSIEIVILGTRDQPTLTHCDSVFPYHSRTSQNHPIKVLGTGIHPISKISKMQRKVTG